MSLVPVESIKNPKLLVSPPRWVWISVISLQLLIFCALFFIPIGSMPVKGTLLALYAIVIMALVKKAKKTNYLVTMQVNRDGVYFQTDMKNHYFFVPWRCVGIIEKAAFPLDKRGLRFEITGEYSKSIRNANSIGNVMTEKQRTFVYTLPQLNDRDKLIERMNYFRRPIFQ